MTIDLSPDDFRAKAVQAVDAICRQLSDVRSGRARSPIGAAVRDRLLSQPLPTDGTQPDVLLQRVFEDVLPYPLGNGSPRFFGWVNSPAAPLGVIGEFVAAAMNSSVAGGGHAATYVEHCVLSWIKQMLGFSNDADAVLTSGGSMANLLCLGAMRHARTAGTVRREGMCQSSRPKLIYATDQGHSCIRRAAEVLGFGARHLRVIPCDSQFRMRTDSLRQQIARDAEDGCEPVCVAASAGTVNTGAIDPLAEIADVCSEHDLWFHVDASYGGFAILLPELAEHFEGFTRADSVAVDPHKWLCAPVACGCALVARKDTLRSAFSVMPEYLGGGELQWLSEYSIELTRPFRALKLWLLLQQAGVAGYERLIRRNIELNDYLQKQIRARSEFRIRASGPLSITCFLYDPGTSEDAERANRRILEAVQQTGNVHNTRPSLHRVAQDLMQEGKL